MPLPAHHSRPLSVACPRCAVPAWERCPDRGRSSLESCLARRERAVRVYLREARERSRRWREKREWRLRKGRCPECGGPLDRKDGR